MLNKYFTLQKYIFIPNTPKLSDDGTTGNVTGLQLPAYLCNRTKLYVKSSIGKLKDTTAKNLVLRQRTCNNFLSIWLLEKH